MFHNNVPIHLHLFKVFTRSRLWKTLSLLTLQGLIKREQSIKICLLHMVCVYAANNLHSEIVLVASIVPEATEFISTLGSSKTLNNTLSLAYCVYKYFCNSYFKFCVGGKQQHLSAINFVFGQMFNIMLLFFVVQC